MNLSVKWPSFRMRPNALGNTVLAVVLTLAGCAQVPQGTSTFGGQSSVREMSACHVAMTFSGTPQRPAAGKLREVREAFGTYHKTEIDVWEYSQFRLFQTGLCICRDAPFSASDAFDDGTTFPNSAKQWRATVMGVGGGPEGYHEIPNLSEPARRYYKITRPDAVSNCMVMQMVDTPPQNQGVERPFFDSLRSTAKAANSGTATPASAVAERLRQIDQLLKDRLITQDEYDSRRRKILESL